MHDVITPAQVPGILIDHESRISALEATQRGTDERVERLEGKLDRLNAMLLKVALGVLGTLVISLLMALLEYMILRKV